MGEVGFQALYWDGGVQRDAEEMKPGCLASLEPGSQGARLPAGDISGRENKVYLQATGEVNGAIDIVQLDGRL